MKRFRPYSEQYPKGYVLGRNEDPAMIDAVVWLSRQRIPFARVSPHQLKIGPSRSFYPVKGTLVFDGQSALPQRGLAALQALLIQLAQQSTDIEAPDLQPASALDPEADADDVSPPWNE